MQDVGQTRLQTVRRVRNDGGFVGYHREDTSLAHLGHLAHSDLEVAWFLKTKLGSSNFHTMIKIKKCVISTTEV